MLEIFNNLFMSIAEQMGAALRKIQPTPSNIQRTPGFLLRRF